MSEINLPPECWITSAAVGGVLAASISSGLTAPEGAASTLRVLDVRPYREIALTVGCSEVAARVRVSRGLSKLAAILDHEAEA